MVAVRNRGSNTTFHVIPKSGYKPKLSLLFFIIIVSSALLSQPVFAAEGDSFAEAITLSGSMSGSLSESVLWVYYKFSVNTGQQVTVTLKPEEGDQDLIVYDPGEDFVGSSSEWGTDVDSVSFTASTSGYHYAQVFGEPGSYTISVSIGGLGAVGVGAPLWQVPKANITINVDPYVKVGSETEIEVNVEPEDAKGLLRLMDGTGCIKTDDITGNLTVKWKPSNVGIHRLTAYVTFGVSVHQSEEVQVKVYGHELAIETDRKVYSLGDNLTVTGKISGVNSYWVLFEDTAYLTFLNHTKKVLIEHGGDHFNAQLQTTFKVEDGEEVFGEQEIKAFFAGVENSTTVTIKKTESDVNPLPITTKIQLTDKNENPVSEAKVGADILLSASIINTGAADQPILYIVQIKDPSGSVIYLKYMESSIPSGDSRRFQMDSPHFKNPGTYIVEIYVWKSWSDPTPLSWMNEAGITFQSS